MRLRQQILNSECYRRAVEEGRPFTRADICQELYPDEHDTAPQARRNSIRSSVGAMLFRMQESGQVTKIGKSLFLGPERLVVYRQPLATVIEHIPPRVQAMGMR